jgi:hypothetical protein
MYESIFEIIPQLFLMKAPEAFKYLGLRPEVFDHATVCGALVHRIHQLPQNVCPRTLSLAWSTYYRHRGETRRKGAATFTQRDPATQFLALLVLSAIITTEVKP